MWENWPFQSVNDKLQENPTARHGFGKKKKKMSSQRPTIHPSAFRFGAYFISLFYFLPPLLGTPTVRRPFALKSIGRNAMKEKKEKKNRAQFLLIKRENTGLPMVLFI
ncbi:hypothetical protein CEXT_82521 [Caerostris extrusa]|uniref:Uncharacterized protein n=1 Tax=Caerostris extrusa TaxID=172846 RepID=A0AAV4YEM9_CAEEX|nr:hypothetical protein CEXT_82521 [Caerostris extrusa]